MKRRTFLSLFVFCVSLVLSYHSVVSYWPKVVRAIDKYVNETHHVNYDYYEDLPSDVVHHKTQDLSVRLLKKVKRIIDDNNLGTSSVISSSSSASLASSLSSASASSSPGAGDFKVVLFWTSWFKKAWWIRFGGGGLDLESGRCPETRCKFTHDRSKIEEASAVLFQSQRFYIEKLPPLRRPNQRWVWVHVEPPTTSLQALATLSPEVGPERNESNDLSPMFNWTMTYHPASDIMEPYGALLPIDQTSVSAGRTSFRTDKPFPANQSYSSRSPSMRPSLLDTNSIEYRKYKKLLKRAPSLKELSESTWEPNLVWDKAKVYSWSYLANERPRLVTWVTSHCSTPSKREDYVSQLHYYITVDVYGLCGTHKCGSKEDHRNDRCWKHLFARKYLFYLAFENSMCDGYITEKVWRPMAYGLVPIVMGGANYSKFLPPNSYINALDYSPEELSQFLLDLQASPDFYIQYHLWRVFWKVTLRPPLCELCFQIHNNTTNSIQHEIPKWWKNIGKCHNPAL